MKKLLLSLVLASLGTAGANAAFIAEWTFETSPPADLNNSTTITGITADSGTGTASGVHSSASTDYSTPSGNGSNNSLSANTWAPNDYYQFSVSTVGFTGIGVSWDQVSSTTGPVSFKLQYSNDGSTYLDFATYTVIQAEGTGGTNISYSDATTGGTWIPSKTATNTSYYYDLSSVTSIDNNGTVSFRLTNLSSPLATGTGRVDNFAIFSPVPEPSTYALLGLGLAGLIVLHRKKFQANA